MPLLNTSESPVRVLSIPERHGYIEAILDPRRIASVPYAKSPEDEPANPWGPPAALDAAWIRENRRSIDAVHVHFSFEQFSLAHIQEFIESVHETGLPLIFTAHDLENPQLPLEEQEGCLSLLSAFITAADVVITLTSTAAEEIERRWGVKAVVIEHPPQFDWTLAPKNPSPAAAAGRERRLGVLLKDARPSLDLELIAEFARAAEESAGWTVEVIHHGTVRAGREEAVARLMEVLEACPSSEALERGRMSDEELREWIAGLDALLLPYGHGTHSGLLELANDLGTRVIVPSVGHFASQRPQVNAVVEKAESGTFESGTFKPGAAAAALERIASVPPLVPSSARALKEALTSVRREHRQLYLRAVQTAAGLRGEGTSLRIAVLAPYRHPLGQPHPGGLESHVWNLVVELRRRGHAVTLAAPEGSDFLEDSPEALRYPRYIWPEHLPVSDSMFPEEVLAQELAAMRQTMSWLAEHAGEFDVIHNHTLHPEPLRWAGRLGTPLVTTFHTPPLPEMLEAMRGLSPVASRSLRCVAVSGHTARAWRRQGVDVDVIRNGVDTTAWTFGAGGPRLCWFGRIVPEKGPHIALRVAELLEMPLVLAGPIGSTDYASAQILPRVTDLSGASEGFRGTDDDEPGAVYLGALTQQELARLVGSSACTVITPLWDEPFGLVAAESLAVGTPVVALRRGGLGQIFDGLDAVTLVDPARGPGENADPEHSDPAGDPPCPERDEETAQRIAAALRTVMPRYLDPEARPLARWSARHAAVKKFSFQRTVDRLEAAYQKDTDTKGAA